MFKMNRVTVLLALMVLTTTDVRSQASSPPHPRDSIEKGLYYEEHERDFSKALLCFEFAEGTARAMGEDRYLSLALDAKNRVREKMGGVASGVQESIGDKELARRILPSFQALEAAELENLKHQIKKGLVADFILWGDRIVPFLAQAFNRQAVDFQFELGVQSPNPKISPSKAALILANMNSGVADAALTKGLEIPDPIVQAAIVAQLDPVRHRALLDRASKDAVDRIRIEAAGRLSALKKDAPPEVMRDGARRGSSLCQQWLLEHSPEALYAIFKDECPRDMQLAGGIFWALMMHDPPQSTLLAMRLARTSFDEPGLVALSWPVGLGNSNPFESTSAWDQRTKDDLEEECLYYFEIHDRSCQAAKRKLSLPGWMITLWNVVAGPSSIRLLMTQPPDGVLQSVMRNATLSGSKSDPQKTLDAYFGDQPLTKIRKAWLGNKSPGSNLQWSDSAVDTPTLMKSWREDDALKLALTEFALARCNPSTVLEPAYIFAINDPRGVVRGPSLDAHIKALDDPEFLARMLGVALASKFFEIERSKAIFDLLSTRDPKLASSVLRRSLTEMKGGGWDAKLSPSMNFLPPDEAVSTFKLIHERIKDPLEAESALAWAAESLRGLPAVGWLVTLPQSTLRPATNAAILNRIGNALFEPGLPFIGAGLKHESPSVREAAVEAMSKLRRAREAQQDFEAWSRGTKAEAEAISELLTLLENPDGEIVAGALAALQGLKAKVALPKIVRLLSSKDPAVKAAAKAALDAMKQP